MSFEAAQEMVLAVSKVHNMDKDSRNLLSDTSFWRRCKAYKKLVSDEVLAAVAQGDYFLIGIDGKTSNHTDRECVFIRIIKRDGPSIKINLFSIAILNFQDENVNGNNLSHAVFDLANFLSSAIAEKHPQHNFCWANIYGISADTTNVKVFLGYFSFCSLSSYYFSSKFE